jgi:hypothetical protein
MLSKLAESIAAAAEAMKANKVKGGKGDGADLASFKPDQVQMGLKVEREHSPDLGIRAEITADHLVEDKDYYTKLLRAGLADELEKEGGIKQMLANLILAGTMAMPAQYGKIVKSTSKLAPVAEVAAKAGKGGKIPVKSFPKPSRPTVINLAERRRQLEEPLSKLHNPAPVEHGTGEGVKKADIIKMSGYLHERIREGARTLQKRAGAAKRQTSYDGFSVKIEYDAGDVRKGVNKKTGEPWEKMMKASYGYIPGTTGVDGEAVDIYLAPNPVEGAEYYLVRQLKDDGSHDEDKVMVGFSTPAEAKATYLEHTPAKYFGGMETLDRSGFEEYLAKNARQKERRSAAS